jgi:hypothetical protein
MLALSALKRKAVCCSIVINELLVSPLLSFEMSCSAHSIFHLSFRPRQKEYFADAYSWTWACEIPEHAVCVPTIDGQHHLLIEEDLNAEVVALAYVFYSFNWFEVALGATMAQLSNLILRYRLDHKCRSTDTRFTAAQNVSGRSRRSSTLDSSASLLLSLNSLRVNKEEGGGEVLSPFPSKE